MFTFLSFYSLICLRSSLPKQTSRPFEGWGGYLLSLADHTQNDPEGPRLGGRKTLIPVGIGTDIRAEYLTHISKTHCDTETWIPVVY